MANKMRPVHPGEILKDELEALDLSASALARALSVPANRVSFILNRKRAVTADTALRLAKFFGTSAEFWLNLQSDYDLKTTIKRSGKKIEREVLTHHEAA